MFLNVHNVPLQPDRSLFIQTLHCSPTEAKHRTWKQELISLHYCVVAQILSPYNKGLVRRAIAQSGGALCPWALNRNPHKSAAEVWCSPHWILKSSLKKTAWLMIHVVFSCEKKMQFFFHCLGRGLLMHCVINYALRLPRMWAAPPMPGWCSVWSPLMPLLWPWTLQPSYQEAQTVSLTQLLTEQLVEETI